MHVHKLFDFLNIPDNDEPQRCIFAICWNKRSLSPFSFLLFKKKGKKRKKREREKPKTKNQKHTLMEATGPISTTKRPRVGRNHHDILRAIEVDVECSNVSRNTRKLLTTQFTHTHKPLGDILASAASELDALFKSEPSTVVAVVIEA